MVMTVSKARNVFDLISLFDFAHPMLEDRSKQRDKKNST